jgi:hypothetical protein
MSEVDDFTVIENDITGPERLWRAFEASVKEHEGEDGLFELATSYRSLTSHDRGVIDDVLAVLCGQTMSTLVAAALVDEDTEVVDEFEE